MEILHGLHDYFYIDMPEELDPHATKQRTKNFFFPRNCSAYRSYTRIFCSATRFFYDSLKRSRNRNYSRRAIDSSHFIDDKNQRRVIRFVSSLQTALFLRLSELCVQTRSRKRAIDTWRSAVPLICMEVIRKWIFTRHVIKTMKRDWPKLKVNVHASVTIKTCSLSIYICKSPKLTGTQST